jgi:hypothetical protein
MTITEFLLERIAEDEATGADLEQEANLTLETLGCRVLAEAAAKRAIIALHAPVTAPHGTLPICAECGDWWDGSPIDYPCDTLRALASVYADHPDYDAGWAA